jgi:hypothetical protein
MEEAGEARGSVIRPDQAAFVVDADGRMSFLIPAGDPDAPLAPGHRLLLAIAARLDDPEWVEDLLGVRRKLGFI